MQILRYSRLDRGNESETETITEYVKHAMLTKESLDKLPSEVGRSTICQQNKVLHVLLSE